MLGCPGISYNSLDIGNVCRANWDMLGYPGQEPNGTCWESCGSLDIGILYLTQLWILCRRKSRVKWDKLGYPMIGPWY